MDFTKGDRVELEYTDDPFTRLQPGTLGTVSIFRVCPVAGATVHVRWDDGSTLSMLLDNGDRIRKVS